MGEVRESSVGRWMRRVLGLDPPVPTSTSPPAPATEIGEEPLTNEVRRVAAPSVLVEASLLASSRREHGNGAASLGVGDSGWLMAFALCRGPGGALLVNGDRNIFRGDDDCPVKVTRRPDGAVDVSVPAGYRVRNDVRSSTAGYLTVASVTVRSSEGDELIASLAASRRNESRTLVVPVELE